MTEILTRSQKTRSAPGSIPVRLVKRVFDVLHQSGTAAISRLVPARQVLLRKPLPAVEIPSAGAPRRLLVRLLPRSGAQKAIAAEPPILTRVIAVRIVRLRRAFLTRSS